jgi:hypothetical protein
MLKKLLLISFSAFTAMTLSAQATSNIGALRQVQQGGSHWCTWSIAKTCSRWRAHGNKSYGLGCAGPNDMRSGCIAERSAK